ncbi:MAG: hypothetical protein BWX75_00841 [Candidatus Cloacimonetes bacterium ADurb.Bin088]|jgi:hypothetical protein|nr:hypothetical protein [Candidatus Cloacimonadota bacterium]OQC09769.1 MAG: hypothetical protein BWX75_00841 [Candidatus Cloacimonetes bacterium ADurb.Bin088]
MKKATLIALLAIMLIGMLALAACGTKEEVVEETTPVEEVVDTLATPDNVDQAEPVAEPVQDATK